MKKQLRCVVSAATVVILSLGLVNRIYEVGKESKISDTAALEAAQTEVLVQDFIHDNYVIDERNPWTDYGLHAINYSYSDNYEEYDEELSAEAAILVDLENKTILYEKNAEKRMYPASITKLMTALTVLQNMKITDVVTVEDEIDMIASDSSTAGFSKGQIVTVEELLNGMLIASGNDAAYILAKNAGKAILENNIENEGKKFTSQQCVQRFVYEMNKNVRDMELENTNFTTPDGYDDENQYTTARDLSKIAIRAYENETISEICKKESANSKTLEKKWESTNQLLNKESEFYYDNCVGLKTGSTDMAGKCLASVAEKDGNTCISIVLNSNTDEHRWVDSKNLLMHGLE